MSTKLKYPYSWGKEPVNAFVEKYARGTYFLAKLLDTSPGKIRHGLILVICSGNSLQFEAVKRVIKTLEGYSSKDLERIGPKDRKLLYKYLLWFAQDDQLDSDFTKKGIDTSSFRTKL